MNQVILIGEVSRIKEDATGMTVSIKTKDGNKKDFIMDLLIEPGYNQEMVNVLKSKPLIAAKCQLSKDKSKIIFTAEKMSVLKLTEDEESNKIVEKIQKDYKETNGRKKTVDKK
jgi:hypothetical protein